jgi:DNA-binding response OmpR family regulator
MLNSAMTDIYLIVDDAIPILRLTKWRLQQAFGCSIDVRLIDNGSKAIEEFQSIVDSGRHDDIVAIIMDYHMPECSGLNAIVAMRKIEHEARQDHRVGIIGFSADISEEMNDLLLGGGADCVLTKPPDPGALEHQCREFKTRRETERQAMVPT